MTMTAQILIGEPHPYHDGIMPSHILFLTENSRAALTLVAMNDFRVGKEGKVTWIPTLENMIDDAMLMIAVHVEKNVDVIEIATTFSKRIEDDWYEFEDISEEDRQKLYEKCRTENYLNRLVVTILEESSIAKKTDVLKHYKVKSVVCLPVHVRK